MSLRDFKIPKMKFKKMKMDVMEEERQYFIHGKKEFEEKKRNTI